MKNRLSQVDSFFVAYQEQSSALMHFGVEFECSRCLENQQIRETLSFLILKYPVLSSRVTVKFFGLAWKDTGDISEMMHWATDTSELSFWRNKPVDPMNAPPFQVMHIRQKNTSILSFKLHHSAGDGEFFIDVLYSLLEFLAGVLSSKKAPDIRPVEKKNLRNVLLKDFKIFSWKKLTALAKHLNDLKKLSKTDDSQRICALQYTPGDIDFITKDISDSIQKNLERYAKKNNLYISALYSAAWVKAIYQWNQLKKQKNSSKLISLEIPVSLRKEMNGSPGNFISPLLIYADGSDSLDQIGLSIQRDFKKGMYRQLYLAIPFFTMPGMYIPWALYKRIALTPLSTGFASSHFTYFHHSKSVEQIMENVPGKKLKSKKLKISRISVYTPVCLKMGAALSVNRWYGRPPGIHLTYRKNALLESDALQLLGLVLAQLKQLK